MSSIKSSPFPKIWPLIIIVLAGLIGAKALLHSGFYTSHDGEHQLVRQYVFDRALKAGHIPPRVDRKLMNGIGYPLFTFTYQFPFILGQAFRFLDFSLADCIKAVFILTYIGSGLTMYLFARELWGKTGGLISAFLYLWAPYRFLTLFVRASLGEHTALLFIPLLLWALNKQSLKPIRIVAGAVGVAGLLLSHMMMVQMFALLIALFWLVRFLESKDKISRLIHLILVLLGGVGLAAYYLLPAYSLRSAIQGLNQLFYSEHFVTLKQLIYSRWGYGFSKLGTEHDEMSFQIGLGHWLVIGTATLLLLKQFIFNKKKLPINSYLLPVAFLLGFVLSIYMMLRISNDLWVWLVTRFFIIDIPWRFLAVAVFSSAVLAGFLYQAIKFKLFRFALFAAILFLTLYGNRNHLRVNKYIDYPDTSLKDYYGTSTSYDEYKPVHTVQNPYKDRIAPDAEVEKGQVSLAIHQSDPHQLILTAEVDTDSVIWINTVYFPGWTLTVNNEIQNIKAVLRRGVIRLPLEQGSHQIHLFYRQIPIMRLGNALSLITAAILLILVTRKKLIP